MGIKEELMQRGYILIADITNLITKELIRLWNRYGSMVIKSYKQRIYLCREYEFRNFRAFYK